MLPQTMIAITIPFFYLKRSEFEKLLGDNYQNTEYRLKGNLQKIFLQSSSLEEELPRMYGPTKLRFISPMKITSNISMGKIKIIIIITMR